MLIRPFVELGLDQITPRLEDILLNEVDRIDHLSSFGRPL